MSSIQQVMDGIATTIHNATSLRCFSYVPEDLHPPALILSLGQVERGAMVRGQFDLNIDAALFVTRVVDRTGQKSANTFASWDSVSSVWKALDATPGVGLSDTDLKVIRYRPFGIDEVAAYEYYGGVFEIIGQTAGA